MNKTVILNFANQVGHYEKQQIRLKDSLAKVGYTGDLLFFNHEERIDSNCPYHKSDDPKQHALGRVSPYAFKAWAFKKAIDEGYENIIWMDSAVYPTKSITNFIKHIEEKGYIFFDNIGYTIGDYTSDACLKNFNWSRDKSFEYPMIMACVMGLNIKSPGAMEFFKSYFHAANDKISFPGSWHNSNGEVSSDLRCKGHRHDQSAASIIIADLKLEITNAQETFFAYTSHKGVLKVADTVCLWSEGM